MELSCGKFKILFGTGDDKDSVAAWVRLLRENVTVAYSAVTLNKADIAPK